MKLKEIFNKFKNSKYKKEIITITIIVFLITVVVTLRGTHAFYNYESSWTPIFSGRVGNFTGKGDTRPLTDKNTDVNLMFYVQDLMSTSGYYIAPSTPVVMSGYALNEKKSNCIPTDATYTKYSDKDYSIAGDGMVTVKVSQSKPNQVVCRIYYDLSGSTNDILVYALIENVNGTIQHNDKTYAFESELPSSGYTDYECKNKDTATNISYNQTTGFTFKTKGPNVCYVYFSK